MSSRRRNYKHSQKLKVAEPPPQGWDLWTKLSPTADEGASQKGRMKSSEFSKVGPVQFWPQPMILLVWGQSCPQVPTFGLEGTRKHPDYKREWTLPR